MKKFLTMVAVAALTLFCMSSCLGEEDPTGSFTFSCIYQSNASDTDAIQAVVDSCRTKEYFKEKSHVYTGLYSTCLDKAVSEFASACNNLDHESICTVLDIDEYFMISLVRMVSDEEGLIVYGCKWTSDLLEDE